MEVTAAELAEDRQAARALSATVKKIRRQAKDLAGRVLTLDAEVRALRGDLQSALDKGVDVNVDSWTDKVEQILVQLDSIHDQQYALVAEALQGRYSSHDIRDWCEMAIEKGAGHPRLDSGLIEDLLRVRRVPNAPFRERLLEIIETERNLGMHHHEGLPRYVDTTIVSHLMAVMDWTERDVKRRLGINPCPGRVGTSRTMTLFIPYETAVKIAPALNLRTYDLGI